MSMVQAPLPTGMPDSVASYCASSRPWAAAGGGAASSNTAPAHRPPNIRSASPDEILLCLVTKGRSSIARLAISFKQKYRPNNALAHFLGVPRRQPRNPLDVGGEYAVYMMAKAGQNARQTGFPLAF